MMKTIYSVCNARFLRPAYLMILLAMLFGSKQTKASHAAGADLTYEYLGNGQYLVTWTLYRDCFGIPAPTNGFLYVESASCGNFSQSYTMNQVPGTGQEITYACATALTTCNGGSATGIQEYEYTATVTLPAQCPDWVFHVSECCRNTAITTLANGGGDNLYIEAYLNNTVYDNNSPTFSNVPVAFECIGQDNYFNHGVIDADGDSLAYFFIGPRTDGNLPCVYAPGYSISNPLTSTPAVSIDPATGDIFMHPTTSEVAVIAVLVQEYRNGVLIGSVMRDMQIYTVQCNNTLPTASGINGTTNFATSSCIGGQLCFDVISSDPDPNDTLTMTWNNAIPAATFTVTGTPHPVGHFCWTPTPNDARPQPYTFTVTVHDNACPSNGVQTYSYSITVSNMTVSVTSTPSVACFGDHNGSASATATGNPPLSYTWTTPSGELYSPSITHLSAGQYTVNIIDGTGCVGTQYFTITEPPALTLSVTGVNGGCNTILGTATANPGGGTAPYTYSWNTNPVQTGQTAVDLNNGTYEVTVTDDHNCHISDTVSVTAGIPITVDMVSTPATCVANDGTATVNITGGSGNITYDWSPNVSTTNSATGLISGLYSCTVTDNVSGCSVTVSTIVNNSSGVTATITTFMDATCSNGDDGSATVVASGGTAPYTYLWMPNGDTTATSNHLSPGTNTVRVTDYNGCSAYATIDIGFTNQAPAIDLGPDSTACVGTTVTLDAGAGYAAYLWSDNSTNQTLDVTANGTYSVLVTDANGCQNFDAIAVDFITCQGSYPARNHGNTGNFGVYPNPTTGSIHIDINRIKDEVVVVNVTDILGHTVLFVKEKAENSYRRTLDLNHLTPGIYMMKVEYGSEINTVRIVKQ